MSATVGYVPGGFDLFHVGHLNILRTAAANCDVLVAGAVSDEVLLETKGQVPFVPLVERLEILSALAVVDHVYAETTTNRLDAWREVGFDVLFKGDDWAGTPKGRALEELLATVGVEVRYLPYTVHTSSTQLRRAITRHALEQPADRSVGALGADSPRLLRPRRLARG